MVDVKARIIDGIIGREGGFVDDPLDSGGATNYGITEKVARQNGYHDHMRDLPRELAFDIYVRRYWDSVRGDDLANCSHAVAEEVVDTAVNLGVKRASEFLQRCLATLNDRGRIYGDLRVDGAIGPATIRALQGYVAVRDDRTLVKALNCLQGAFYIELAERREKDERFLYGWLKNRVG